MSAALAGIAACTASSVTGAEAARNSALRRPICDSSCSFRSSSAAIDFPVLLDRRLLRTAQHQTRELPDDVVQLVEERLAVWIGVTPQGRLHVGGGIEDATLPLQQHRHRQGGRVRIARGHLEIERERPLGALRDGGQIGDALPVGSDGQVQRDRCFGRLLEACLVLDRVRQIAQHGVGPRHVHERQEQERGTRSRRSVRTCANARRCVSSASG